MFQKTLISSVLSKRKRTPSRSLTSYGNDGEAIPR